MARRVIQPSICSLDHRTTSAEAGHPHQLTGLAQVHLQGAEHLHCCAPHHSNLEPAGWMQKCCHSPCPAAASEDNLSLSETTAVSPCLGWEAGACTAPDVPDWCQAGNPSPCTAITFRTFLAAGRAMDNGGTKQGSSTEPWRGWTIIFLLCIHVMPSTKVRYRGTKAGGRLYSAHTSYLCLLGRKEPFVWKQQLLPQKHSWGICACKSPC